MEHLSLKSKIIPESFKTLLRYPLIGGLILLVLAMGIAPISRSLVEQWTRNDVEMRARLAFTSTQGPLMRALTDSDELRLSSILEGIARDERILAVGICDTSGTLRARTANMPPAFSCANVARSDDATFAAVLNDGRRVLVGSFLISHTNDTTHLVILHDLSFGERRSGQAQTLVVTILVGAVLIFAAISTIMGLVFARSWMRALHRSIEDLQAGRSPAPDKKHTFAVSNEIQRLLKTLSTTAAPTETADTQWTPQSLHDLLQGALPGAEVFIVSNREPYIHNHDGERIVLQTPASGLVSALEPVMRACGGTWIAHGSGSADKDTVDAGDRVRVPPANPTYNLRRVWITEEEQEGYYYGFANEGLWPLCHIAFVRPTFRDSDWRHYEEINQRFADAVVQEAKTEDPIVLVQDYHFALAPKMIRDRLPKAMIVTFWHIPWPNAETFGICPWKERILEGMLGSTILGFHTQFHCNNFFETVDRFIESRLNREHSTVTLNGEETLIRPYPISIEWPPKAMDTQEPVDDCRRMVRARLGLSPEAKLAVGIERFDYTKGILDRMRAIDLLLTQYPNWREQFTFVQVAAPTRSKLSSYSTLQQEAIELANDINERHKVDDRLPVQLIIRHHEPEEVFELFRAADLCIVSSLHDGMNLVAKEFVASRDDEQGVLILSSFTGASREMSEALIVNPYDGGEMAQALDAALRMPASEQRERMRLMRQQVREQNVYRWAGRMLVDAARLRQRRRILEIAESANV
jgi:trehalose 6-phosphate synthase